ncbi:hypothetical protein ACLSU7_05295 [Bdellovibrio sp. HCB185ZH]|uniref:hypothetical protein n=1 Tax=Bdellovibrio sp. HCB185ZH TaxID=3394235 RepID=UPI0039A7015B
MKAVLNLVLFVSTFVFGVAHAEEINSPVLVEQAFQAPEKAPETLKESLLQTAVLQFITSDLIPGQKMTVQLAAGMPKFSIQSDDSGKISLVFDAGFPKYLKNYSIEEIQPDYFELRINSWNIMSYPSLKIKAQIFSETGQSVAVQFANPVYPGVNIQASADLPLMTGKAGEIHELQEWFSFLFRQTQVISGTPLQLALSHKMKAGESDVTTPILLVPLTSYNPAMTEQLAAAVKSWLIEHNVNTENSSLQIDFTIVKEKSESGTVPVYKIQGLDLNYKNVAL